MSSRRIGLEQEFFVVEPDGASSNRADDLVQKCLEIAGEHGVQTSNFATEWVKNILELNTPPAENPETLAESYHQILKVALQAAKEIGVRLYPYSVYPIHLIPVMRDETNYHVQVRTVGHDRFLNAGKCAGTHMHLEVPAGTVDPLVGVSYNSSAEDRQELLNTYNLATALDPVMIALSRACPFYEGQSTGLAHRTARYRGNENYGWEGVYTKLPKSGGLRPYGESVEHLVNMQFDRHYAWMDALDAADVEREKFAEAGGNLLTSSWNPVRLNGHGTIELRNIDSNMPEIVIGIMVLVSQLHQRLLDDQLIVTPTEGQEEFEIKGNQLLVPDFEHLHHKLLFAAVSEGMTSPIVLKYAESAIRIARMDTVSGPITSHLPSFTNFKTTESLLLDRYYPEGETLTKEKGLQLVRDACDELEEHVAKLVQ